MDKAQLVYIYMTVHKNYTTYSCVLKAYNAELFLILYALEFSQGLIGASLSEPHTDKFRFCRVYIYIYMYIYIYAPYVRLTVYFYLQQRQRLRRSREREREMGMRLLTSLPNNGGGGACEHL